MASSICVTIQIMYSPENKNKFQHQLQSDFGYQTLAGRHLAAQYIPGFKALSYYARLGIILLTASTVARTKGIDDDRWADFSLQNIRNVESIGGRLVISGLEEVARHRGALVYIANHMSLLETFILPCITLAFNRVTFVIKQELLQYPVIGHIMKAVDLIAVSRRSPRHDLKVVLTEGQKVLQQGKSIIIFPQATRSVVFDVQAFNTLGVKLAARAGVPVVPVAIKTDFQSNGKWFRDVGPIDPRKTLYLKFGPLIRIEGKGKDAHRQVVEFIASNLLSWGGQVKYNRPGQASG